MNIRDAAPEDASRIASLLVACWRSAYADFVPADYLDLLDEHSWAQRIRDGIETGPQRTYVGEDESGIVGFVTIGACRDEDRDPHSDGEVWGLYVAPERWGQGFGSALCAAGLAALTAQGFTSVSAWVFEDNGPGLRFYASAGFESDGVSKTLERGVTLKVVRVSRPLGCA
jgi:ribosomal protein S18 acetylase RimI-like enzyme